MTVLVTGAAGFIGMHVVKALLNEGRDVIGVDNLNDYYDVALKEARVERLNSQPRFRFYKADISDRDAMFGIIEKHPGITGIIHLAAQAGVRHSLADPYVYVTANLMGQVVMLEAALQEAAKSAGIELSVENGGIYLLYSPLPLN